MRMQKGKVVVVVLSILVLCSIVCADWNEGDLHKMHWAQTPKPGGCDVEFGASMLGDDWKCSQSGAVSDVHLWVSWMDNMVQPIGMMTVSIYSDVPAVPGTNYFSHPGQLLWIRDFSSTQIKVRDMLDDMQSWYDPSTGVYTRNNHTKWQQINITNIDKPFLQTEGEIYWLVVNFGQLPFIGWKESGAPHFNDDAVWMSPTGAWQELRDPTVTTNNSIDLAFVITPEPTTLIIFAVGGILLRRR